MEACAYFFDRNICIEYPAPGANYPHTNIATQSNGMDGYYCRRKPGGRQVNIHKPPCAASCPDMPVPSCSTYQTFIQPNGCAQFCSAAVRATLEAFICGRVPQCASTCPSDMEPTCD